MNDDSSSPAPLSGTTVKVGSSLRRRWTHRFALVLVLSLVSGAASLLVVVNLAGSMRGAAAEVDRESTVMIDLRGAIQAEDALAHQLVDQGSAVAAKFLAVDARTTQLLRHASATYNSDAELALVTRVSAGREDAYASLRPIASAPALADRFGPELPNQVTFHLGLDSKRTAIGASLAKLDAVSRETVHHEIQTAKAAERWLIALLGTLFVVSAALTLLLARKLAREVLVPIDRLSDSARRFAAGELDHRIDAAGGDEFGQLATQFNAMAMAIAASHQHLTTQAHYDNLTGLLNRARFLERLQDTFENTRGGPVWIAFVDLDDFKIVNDSRGHDAGDEVLRQVANRLLAATRPLDIVARLGGDEFAIIFGADADEATAELVAQRVLDALEEPLRIFGNAHQIGASIGLACRDAADVTTDMLIRRADVAMYTAKGRGKNCWQRFDADTHGNLIERRLADLTGP